MKRRLIAKVQTVMLFMGLLFVWSSVSWATTYYVGATIGNDSNTGTSLTSAWKTIQKAADTMVAGDTVMVQPGNYPERVDISRKSGLPGAPITFLAQGIVVTKGFGIYLSDYVRIEGFEITGTVIETWSRWGRFGGAGIALEGNYCQIINNYIHDVAGFGIDIRGLWDKDSTSTTNCIVKGNRIAYAGTVGIHVEGRNHLIEGNDISHTLQYPPKLYDPPSYVDADGIRFFGTGHIIRKNHIHDILHAPENLKDPHIDFFQTWETAYDIIIEQNMCVNPNTTGSNQILMLEQAQGPVKNLIFRNNIFVMNDPGYSPLVIMDKGQTFVENVTIVNNVFVHPNGIGEYGVRLRNVRNAVVKNNIFYDYGNSTYNYIFKEGIVENLAVGHNCIFKSDGQAPAGTPNSGDLWMVDPNFVDFPAMNFRLKENSLLIDAGVNLSEVREDYDGMSRPQGSSNDIGAFEHSPVDTQPDKPKNLGIVS